jgi:hypothetical protein
MIRLRSSALTSCGGQTRGADTHSTVSLIEDRLEGLGPLGGAVWVSLGSWS